MRYFPSASRQRAVVTALVTAAALGGAAVPLANAADDPLKDKQKQVEKQIDQVQENLGEASRRAQRASARLDAVRAQLSTARANLADVRARLVTAQAKDAEMQTKLVEAEEALAQARQDLADGQAALASQRTEVVNTVNDFYESGDPHLLALSSLMNAKTPEDVVRQMGATDAIVGRQDREYADLHAAEIQLAARETLVESAKKDMEDRRADAAANLAMVRDLVVKARDARTAVVGLLVTTRDARATAVRARARDARVLRELKQREARIKEQILAAAARAGNGGYKGSTNGILDAPTANGYVTSPFGYRTHPIYGYWGLHDGTDFGVSCGQSLRAVASGTVMDTYYSSVYGNRLYLNLGQYNGKNLTAVYNHLQGYKASEGQRVKRGDVVGYAGNTGWSTGCHLHFTILVNGDPVDPMKFL